MITYTISHTDSQSGARVGQVTTPHGAIETPAFMPVGSLGPVKGITPEELASCGYGLMLSNAYHLYLRPGHQLIADQGGLHRFTGWKGAFLTDSGGFQLVSLSELCQVEEQGVQFKSHFDGSQHLLTPELSMQIQMALGSDIMMVLDECPLHPCSKEKAHEAVQRTTRWAQRCLTAAEGSEQALFGIVQGGLYPDLRQLSARELVQFDFPGYALGGLSLGEEKGPMFHMIETVVAELPLARPRYLMGVGMPEDLVEGVFRGVDLFDCVIPSRHGRTGWLFTSTGRVLIKNAQYARDDSPIDSACRCPVCTVHSRAYLRHLFMTHEMLGARLNTLHNLWYYAQLMSELREAIRQDRLLSYRREFYERRKDYARSTAYAEMAGIG